MEGKYSHFAEISKEELQAIGHKGGTRSGEARRKRASAREAAELLLSLPLTNPDMIERLQEMGMPENETPDNMTATVLSLMLKSWTGDANAAKLLLDLIGEGPATKIDASVRHNAELGDILKQLKEK